MNPRIVAVTLLCVLGAAIVPGCNRSPRGGPVNRNLPSTTIQLGSQRFIVEIAKDEPTRRTGLMNRPSMPPDHGMIFVFPVQQPLGFWMDNTLIPLDIIYLDREGRVVSIHSMQPLDLRKVASAAPAKYAIELNHGAAARTGLRPGDPVQIPAEALNTDR